MQAFDLAKQIVFHYPGSLFSQTDTGEKKRPKKILETFQSLNYDVTILAGTYREREERFQHIKKNISQYDLVYSENSNLPLSTTGKSRFPQFNSVDYQLFELSKNKGIPIGVFIRDVFWKVKDTSKAKAIHKRILGNLLFNHEVKHYYKTCTKIFLPTESCKNYLPPSDFKNFQLLPPAAEIITFEKKAPKEIKNVVYVGSCQPPVYQVIKGFQSLLTCPNIQLTIVTRPSEQGRLWSILGKNLQNLSVLTASDEALSKILQNQDIGLACIDSNEYWNLAMPIKVFDYIGHQLPILTYSNGETAKLVIQNQIGWAIEGPEKIPLFIKNLTNQEINNKSTNIKNYLKQNTWQDRVKTIINALKKTE